ncbi:MAG: J domain-containing protein [Lautropia sp.]
MNAQPSQASLFDDDPPQQMPVRVGVVGSASTLTKAQKAFNRWIARIDEQRRELAQWQAFSETFQARVAKDYEPLRRRYQEQQLALMRRFDEAHDGGELGKRERGRLAHVIRENVSELLGHRDDPALVALHDKYSDIRHEDVRREQTEAMRAMVEDVLGTSLDGDLESPEDVLNAARAWVAGDDSAADGAADESPDYDSAESSDASFAHAGERTRAKQQARAQREQAMADGATQSVREAWRKLASALHPDREPDPAERERKTRLMQRANQAYEARDLLQLLTLQIEVEQIDLSRLAETSDARLAHYNQVLREQSEGLAAEIDAVVAGYAANMDSHPGGNRRNGPTPSAVLEALNRDIAELRQDCRALARDLEQFKDIRQVKAWLKTVRISRSASSDQDAFGEEIEAIEAMMVEAMIDRTVATAFGGKAGGGRRGDQAARGAGARGAGGRKRGGRKS